VRLVAVIEQPDVAPRVQRDEIPLSRDLGVMESLLPPDLEGLFGRLIQIGQILPDLPDQIVELALVIGIVRQLW